MPKEKYYYNPNTLRYEKYKLSIKQRFVRVLGFFTSAFFFGFLAMVLGYSFFETPEEKKNQQEINEILDRYEILNKRIDALSGVLQDLSNKDDNIYRVIFEADPLPDEIRNLKIERSKIYAELKNVSEGKIISETLEKIEALEKKTYVQSKSYKELIELIKKKEDLLHSIPAIQPVANKDLKRMASGYGYRIDPVYKTRKFHAGMDFTAPTGTPVYATGDGVVKIASNQGGGYGNKVVIDHGFGYHTLYAHNSKILVKAGQKVKRGETIALVGSTGKSTGPHCHYEVWKNGTKINPINFYFNDLSPEEYDKIIEMSDQNNQSFD
ncbi:MAG: M23 family metallopeptidase [Chitinophagales bacterium]|nr:M23 family metallopeptidase [Chitinophagales bacterium]